MFGDFFGIFTIAGNEISRSNREGDLGLEVSQKFTMTSHHQDGIGTVENNQ